MVCLEMAWDHLLSHNRRIQKIFNELLYIGKVWSLALLLFRYLLNLGSQGGHSFGGVVHVDPYLVTHLLRVNLYYIYKLVQFI